jgi:hypothetical protein
VLLACRLEHREEKIDPALAEGALFSAPFVCHWRILQNMWLCLTAEPWIDLEASWSF